MTCVQPASRYSSIAAMQSSGVPAIGLQRSSASRCTLPSRQPTAALHRLGDGSDLVAVDLGQLEQRVRRAADVLHLVGQVHPRDFARAVTTRVAVAGMDRGDDGAADVDLGRDVLTRGHERRCRDRRRQPSAISPASACIFGAVAARYTGEPRGGVRVGAQAGTEALHVSPSYSNASAPSTPRTIVTASRIGPSVFDVGRRMLFRKIFDVPKPSRNRPGPAASCTTRASMATWTGCRVNGEMIPSRS